MNDNDVYHIQIRGQVNEEEINAISPVRMEQERADTAVTQFAVQTDQSGLIGLLRHLHGLGFVFLYIDGLFQIETM